MGNFDKIKAALEYIDSHLGEPMSYESLAKMFYFSPYYFHRMFSAIVGESIAAYIRDRRFMRACEQLASTGEAIINIGFDCGYDSAQSFSRAFRSKYGLPPSEYRKQGYAPVIVTADELIMKFTNRLRGGVFVNPKIIKRNALTIAGVSGDGDETGKLWKAFEKLCGEMPLTNKVSENGYEIRLYDGVSCIVHVGVAVSAAPANAPAASPVPTVTASAAPANAPSASPMPTVTASAAPAETQYELYELPACEYASFDVYVANGYDSENSAMDEWLKTNQQGYTQKLLGDAHYCVEYYDERFHGEEAGSIVEIWVPIEKKK
jgi:AraC-like DNA-binding protein